MDWLEKFEIQFQLLSSLVRMICDQKASGDRRTLAESLDGFQGNGREAVGMGARVFLPA